MKERKLVFLILVLFSFVLLSSAHAQIESAMTFNIRWDNPDDGEHNWQHRKSDVVKMLNYYSPSVVGLQEVLEGQLNYLKEGLSHYNSIGVGRADGKTKGEYSPILYDTRKSTLIESSTFWLSDTPDIIASVGWDASMERICTYGLFESNETKEKFYVFNIHYDHIGELARTNSSKLVMKKIKSLNKPDLPVVLIGDFNAEKEKEAIQTILAEMNMTGNDDHIYGPSGTWASFDSALVPVKQIDFVFSKGLEVVSYRHVDDKTIDGKNLSDHLAVFVKFN